MTLVASRELDALVAEKVMGLEVVGDATGVFVEGEWSVHVDSEPEGWACHAAIHPVMVRHCSCDLGPFKIDVEPGPTQDEYNARQRAEWESDQKRFGHSRRCLTVVPRFSEEIQDAWQVVGKLRERFVVIDIGISDGGIRVQLFEKFGFGGRFHAEADTAPMAICLAALKAVEGQDQ